MKYLPTLAFLSALMVAQTSSAEAPLDFSDDPLIVLHRLHTMDHETSEITLAIIDNKFFVEVLIRRADIPGPVNMFTKETHKTEGEKTLHELSKGATFDGTIDGKDCTFDYFGASLFVNEENKWTHRRLHSSGNPSDLSDLYGKDDPADQTEADEDEADLSHVARLLANLGEKSNFSGFLLRYEYSCQNRLAGTSMKFTPLFERFPAVRTLQGKFISEDESSGFVLSREKAVITYTRERT